LTRNTVNDQAAQYQRAGGITGTTNGQDNPSGIANDR
jgi:hypothetical protein